MGGLKNGITVADIGSRRDTETSHLRRAGVRNVVTIEIRRGQYRILFRTGNDLLEDGICNAIVNHELRLPSTLAVSGVNGVEDAFHFFFNGLPKSRRRKFHSGLDENGIVCHREVGVLVFVVEDPALTLGNDLSAKLLRGHFIPPGTERAFCKFLNIAFMNQRYRLQLVLQSMLNGDANQSLGASDRDGFDAHAGIEPNLLLTAL